MALTWKEFENILSHTRNNEIEMLHSKKAGCLFCGYIIDARKVNKWTSDLSSPSAICPRCGMNMILGDASGHDISRTKIDEIQEFILSNPDEIFDKHHEIVDEYIDCFERKNIFYNELTESLYKHFLFLELTKNNNASAAYKIAELFEFGTRYTKPDYDIALNYYSHPGLAYDTHAIGRYGICSYKSDKNNAFTYYSSVTKSSALGSLYGLSYLADIYIEGKLDRKDPDFAFSIVENAYFETYNETFFRNNKTFLSPLICLAYRMGYFYEKGLGCVQDADSALVFYLLIEKLYDKATKLGKINPECDYYYKLSQTHLKKIAKKKGYVREDALLDEKTFVNSMFPLSYVGGGKLQTRHLEIPYIAFVSPEEYDDETKVFTFSVRYAPKKPLIIDAKRLYCEENDYALTWSFNNVKDVIYHFEDQDETIFSKLEVNQNSIIFYSHENGNDIPVLEVQFEKQGTFTGENENLIEA